MSIKLSVLDRSPVNEGEDPTTGILNTVKLAQIADALGFHRFWVAEHHGSDVLVGSSPEVLISHLISNTKRIRVGSGGVMLQHYSPYKVAENFNLLALLAPNRVDLGIGRGPGGLPITTRALLATINSEPIPFNEKVNQLDAYLLPKSEESVLAQPVPSIPPELHVLGTGESSAELAAQHGLPFVYAHFINGDDQLLRDSLTLYKSSFNYSKGRIPGLIIAVSVLFAETEEEAERLAAEKVTYKVHLESGRTLSIYSLELAERLGQQANEPYSIEVLPSSLIYGTKETVAKKIYEISKIHEVEEVMVLPAEHDYQQRILTYELLAAGMKQYQEEEIVR